MQRAKEKLPVKIDSPAAVVRQQPGFGNVSGYGEISAEHIRLSEGTDISPLLEGLEGDMCQSPHWGYVLNGSLNVRYSDGAEETDGPCEVFYWPPGHTVRAEEDSEIVLFSPHAEHVEVLDHMLNKMGASS